MNKELFLKASNIKTMENNFLYKYYNIGDLLNNINKKETLTPKFIKKISLLEKVEIINKYIVTKNSVIGRYLIIDILLNIYKFSECEISDNFKELSEIVILDIEESYKEIINDNKKELEKLKVTKIEKKKYIQLIDNIYKRLIEVINLGDFTNFHKVILRISNTLNISMKKENNINLKKETLKKIKHRFYIGFTFSILTKKIENRFFKSHLKKLDSFYGENFIQSIERLYYTIIKEKKLTEKEIFYLVNKGIKEDIIKKVYINVNKNNIKDKNFPAYTDGREIYLNLDSLFIDNLKKIEKIILILADYSIYLINDIFYKTHINILEKKEEKKNNKDLNLDNIKYNKILVYLYRKNNEEILFSIEDLEKELIDYKRNKYFGEKISILNLIKKEKKNEKRFYYGYIVNNKKIKNNFLLFLEYNRINKESNNIILLTEMININFNNLDNLIKKVRKEKLNIKDIVEEKKYIEGKILDKIYNTNRIDKEEGYFNIIKVLDKYINNIKKINFQDILEISKKLRNKNFNMINDILENLEQIRYRIKGEDILKIILKNIVNISEHEVLHIIYKSLDKNIIFDRFKLDNKFKGNIINIIDDSYINETIISSLLGRNFFEKEGFFSTDYLNEFNLKIEKSYNLHKYLNFQFSIIENGRILGGVDFISVYSFLRSTLLETYFSLLEDVLKYSLLEDIKQRNMSKDLVNYLKDKSNKEKLTFEDIENYDFIINYDDIKEFYIKTKIGYKEFFKVIEQVEKLSNKLDNLNNYLLDRILKMSFLDNKNDIERLFFMIIEKILKSILVYQGLSLEYKIIIKDKYISDFNSKSSNLVQDELTHKELENMEEQDIQDKIKSEHIKGQIEKEIFNKNGVGKGLGNLFYQYYLENIRGNSGLSKLINNIKKVTIKKQKDINNIDKKIYNKYNLIENGDTYVKKNNSIDLLIDVSGSMDIIYVKKILSSIIKTLGLITKKTKADGILNFAFFDYTLGKNYLIYKDIKSISVNNINIEDIQGGGTLLSSNYSLFKNRIEAIKTNSNNYNNIDETKYEIIDKKGNRKISKKDISKISKILKKTDKILIVISDFLLFGEDLNNFKNKILNTEKEYKKIILVNPERMGNIFETLKKHIGKKIVILDNFRL